MESNKNVVRYKMVIFGNVKVGKTSLLERYVNDRFQDSYISTLGYNVYEKRISYKDSEISLMIYDIGGQEKFREVRKKYAEGANTAFIVYDITNLESFENIVNWRNDLEQFSGDIPFVLIGNKVDLENSRKVSKEKGLELSKEINALDFIETSAKTGESVQKAFEECAIKTYDTYIGK
ncbi:MAG: GTP-binding protein [Candidatus Lokiarchaeota archaeon]|nr:GTP-binding protein [Candidatus Lokiarchaeota archaeon]